MIPAFLASVVVPTALGWLLLLGLVAWTLWIARTDASAKSPKLDGLWWLVAALTLLAFRWPLLGVPHQQNPDESQLIAGAITLRHDPVFWRSLDGGTAGPLDYYPLLPAAWGDGIASYAIARAIAVAVVFGTIMFAAETLALLAGAAVARIAALPALAFYALTTHPDLTHYSTEIMPALLLAAGGYAAMRYLRSPSRGLLWLTALLLGSVPWAKPQAAPIAVLIWGLLAVHEVRAQRRESLMVLFAGSLLLALACFALAAATGQTEHMVVPFLLHNLGYVRAPQYSWAENAWQQWQNSLADGYLGLWLMGSAAFALLTCWRLRSASTAWRRTVLVGCLLLAAGIFSALGPRRPSMHHLHLIVLPVLWLVGIGLAVAWPRGEPRATRARLLVTGVFLLCTLVPQVAWRLRIGDAFAGSNAHVVRAANRRLATLVRDLTAANEPIAIWGWRCSLYVEAARYQATCQAQSEGQIYAGPLQAYFLRRYLDNFEAAQPPVFVDAVGPGNFAFEAAHLRHEAFAPLRERVQTHYTLIAAIDGTRVYLRNDRLAARATKLP